MDRNTERYLRHKTHFERWPLNGHITRPIKNVIVIPCIREYLGLFKTLDDIANAHEAESSVVIVVINNRQNVSTEDLFENKETLEELQKWDHEKLNVCWVDASSVGNELPNQEGVGMARKIGLDWALKLLAERNQL